MPPKSPGGFRAISAAKPCAPAIAADDELAISAGLMEPVTRPAGLSLGDRICPALAQRLRCPTLTANRNWLKIADAIGVDVRLIR